MIVNRETTERRGAGAFANLNEALSVNIAASLLAFAFQSRKKRPCEIRRACVRRSIREVHCRGKSWGGPRRFAVLQGDEVKIFNEQSASLADCPDLLTSLMCSETQHGAGESVNVLIRLAVSMRAPRPRRFSSRRTSGFEALEGIRCAASSIRPKHRHSLH